LEKEFAVSKNRSVAARIDSKKMNELKKLFPKESPSQILRILVEERIAVQRNTDSLYAARKALAGKKSDREML
jgi:hypothetical protein